VVLGNAADAAFVGGGVARQTSQRSSRRHVVDGADPSGIAGGRNRDRPGCAR
jgi:hypothetical protein